MIVMIIILFCLIFASGFIWGVSAIPEKYFKQWFEDMEEIERKWDLEDKIIIESNK